MTFPTSLWSNHGVITSYLLDWRKGQGKKSVTCPVSQWVVKLIIGPNVPVTRFSYFFQPRQELSSPLLGSSQPLLHRARSCLNRWQFFKKEKKIHWLFIDGFLFGERWELSTSLTLKVGIKNLVLDNISVELKELTMPEFRGGYILGTKLSCFKSWPNP